MAKERINHNSRGRNIREYIFGIEDGLVSTFGIVTGVATASLSGYFVILAGLANLFAGGISMMAGTYLSTKSQKEFYENELRRERKEIKNMPRIEREEVKTIYYKKGFRGKRLENVVNLITSNKDIWLKVMMVEELGLIQHRFLNPLRSSGVMGFSFGVGALFPMIPYFFIDVKQAFPISIFLTVIGLFLFGALKTIYTDKRWFKAGIEMVIVGMIAGIVGYLIGVLFRA